MRPKPFVAAVIVVLLLVVACWVKAQPTNVPVVVAQGLPVSTNYVLAGPATNFFDTNILHLTNALTAAGYAAGGGGVTGAVVSINGQDGEVVLGATDIEHELTAANLTPTDNSIWGALAGIDTALGLRALSTHDHAGVYEPAGVAASDITDSTASGRGLLTAANAAAQRTALELGTAAQSATGDFAAASHTHTSSQITDFTEAVEALLGEGGGGIADAVSNGIAHVRLNSAWVTNEWDLIQDKPTTFTPASHAHAGEDITSGTVAAARLDSAMATDSEVASGYQPLDPDLTRAAGSGIASGQVWIHDGTGITNVATTGSGSVVRAGSPTLTGTAAADVLTVTDDAYDAGDWNGSAEVPTKNAIRDKIEALGGGSGDVVGPASSTDNAVALYDDTTGNLLRDSSITSDGDSLTLAGPISVTGAAGANEFPGTNNLDTVVVTNGLTLGGEARSAWPIAPSVIRFSSTSTGTAASNSTYYVGAGHSAMNVAMTNVQIPVMSSGVIRSFWVHSRIATTAAGAGNVVLTLMLNGSTPIGSATQSWDIVGIRKSEVHGLTQAVTSNDVIHLQIATPAFWTTNAGGVFTAGDAYLWP